MLPALRTEETLEALALEARPTIFHPALYNAAAGTLYERLKMVPDACESVLLVAHNPGVSDLLRFLGDAQRDFSPATLAVVTCACAQWKALLPGRNHLTQISTRKNRYTRPQNAEFPR